MISGQLARLLLLVALVAVAAPTVSFAAEGQQAAFVPISGTVVSAPGVNIRDCPRVDCAVRAVALLGEQILITGEGIEGFVPVDWGGMTGFAYGLYIATPERGAPELRQGRPGCNRVAFIFNVGVGYDTRMAVLDALKADDVAATIFAMGWWADENPDLLEQIDDAGFPIASHGDQRVKLTTLGDAAIKQDIQAAATAIDRAVGEPPRRYFTPYAADSDQRVRGIIARSGYLPVAWTIPADDWDFDAEPNAIFENVVPNIYDGAIVEFHLDAPATAESTAIALPWIVERLRLQGYRFVTIPELAQPCN